MSLDFINNPIPEITFSGIIGNCKKEGNFYILFPDEKYYLSLSGLEFNASNAIQNLKFNSSLDFLGIQLDVINRENKITSYEEIYSKLVANDPHSIREYTINFFDSYCFCTRKN